MSTIRSSARPTAGAIAGSADISCRGLWRRRSSGPRAVDPGSGERFAAPCFVRSSDRPPTECTWLVVPILLADTRIGSCFKHTTQRLIRAPLSFKCGTVKLGLRETVPDRGSHRRSLDDRFTSTPAVGGAQKAAIRDGLANGSN